MVKELKKNYFTLLAPAGVGFALVCCARFFNVAPLGGWQPPKALAAGVFILSAVCALAAPIYLRTLFAHKMRGRKQVARVDLIGLERTIIRLAGATPYLGLLAYALGFPQFYFTATMLMMFYALYYHFPSQRRIDFDRRIFRVS